MYSTSKIADRIVSEPTSSAVNPADHTKYGALDGGGLPGSLTPFAKKLLELHQRQPAASKAPLTALKETPSATASLNYLLELRERSHAVFENRRARKRHRDPNVITERLSTLEPRDQIRASRVSA